MWVIQHTSKYWENMIKTYFHFHFHIDIVLHLAFKYKYVSIMYQQVSSNHSAEKWECCCIMQFVLKQWLQHCFHAVDLLAWSYPLLYILSLLFSYNHHIFVASVSCKNPVSLNSQRVMLSEKQPVCSAVSLFLITSYEPHRHTHKSVCMSVWGLCPSMLDAHGGWMDSYCKHLLGFTKPALLLLAALLLVEYKLQAIYPSTMCSTKVHCTVRKKNDKKCKMRATSEVAELPGVLGSWSWWQAVVECN